MRHERRDDGDDEKAGKGEDAEDVEILFPSAEKAAQALDWRGVVADALAEEWAGLRRRDSSRCACVAPGVAGVGVGCLRRTWRARSRAICAVSTSLASACVASSATRRW